MLGWLEGFDWHAGELKARIRSGGEVRATSAFRELWDDGVPQVDQKIRRALSTDFKDWAQAPMGRYLAAFDGPSATGEDHAVFSFRCGRSEYLVPALVLMRGLFPVVADALAYAFTPRPLEALCLPITRAGHWTVATPDLTGAYNGRFRRPAVESLAWASIYPSARKTWVSVYRAACEGRMSLDLPKATVRVVPYGVRVGRAVHVTRLIVNALLAQEEPERFAAGAARSFVLMTNSEPLAPNPNDYYGNHEGGSATQYCLTDDEWANVRHFCEVEGAMKGRPARDSARNIADGLVIRAATSLPWQEIPVQVAPNALALHSRNWRGDGRLHRLLNALRQTRGDQPYLLECAADGIAAKHSRKASKRPGSQ